MNISQKLAIAAYEFIKSIHQDLGLPFPLTKDDVLDHIEVLPIEK